MLRDKFFQSAQVVIANKFKRDRIDFQNARALFLLEEKRLAFAPAKVGMGQHRPEIERLQNSEFYGGENVVVIEKRGFGALLCNDGRVMKSRAAHACSEFV